MPASRKAWNRAGRNGPKGDPQAAVRSEKNPLTNRSIPERSVDKISKFPPPSACLGRRFFVCFWAFSAEDTRGRRIKRTWVFRFTFTL